MKKLTFLSIILATAFVNGAYAQQDPLLSQYQFNQLPINPAYAGVNDITSFDLQFRSQWSGVDGAPTTALLSANSSVADNKVGVGFSLIYDEVGINENIEFNLTYAYELDISHNTTLSFGLQSGITSLRYDFARLTLEDFTDDDFVTADDQLSKFNFGTGLFLSSKKYYLGLSIPRLLKLTEEIGPTSAERYNRHYYLTGGIILDPWETIRLKPYTIIRTAESSRISADAGVNALFADVIWGGVFTRNLDVLGLNIYLNLSNGLRIGYTGEITSGSLPSSSFSTHEVSLGIDLKLLENHLIARRYY